MAQFAGLHDLGESSLDNSGTISARSAVVVRILSKECDLRRPERASSADCIT
jgi:hypothetical protein